jgi:hypothetical protein
LNMSDPLDQTGNVYTTFCSASVMWGASGYGKSTLLHAEGETAYEAGSKIIGLNDDEGRFEYAFYAFKGRESLFEHFCKTQVDWGNVSAADWEAIKKGEKYFSDIFSWEPKAYPTEVFVPATPQTPHRLPEIFKPFTIAFSKIKPTELKLLLGKLSKRQERTIDILWMKNRKKTFEDFIQLVKDYAVDRKVEINDIETNICEADEGIDLIYKLDRIYRLGFISTKDNPLDLNLTKILWDNKTITAFSFFNIEDGNVRFTLYAFLLRRIRRLRTNKLKDLSEKYFPELNILIHELQELAPANGYEDPYAAEGQKVCRRQLAKLMKQPRDIFVRIRADSQDPAAVFTQCRSGFKTTFIFYAERSVLDNIRALVYFPEHIYIGLQRSAIGVYCIKSHPTGGKDYTGVNYPMMSIPPRSMVKSPEDRFFRAWLERGGVFKEWYFDAPDVITDFKRRKKEKLKDVPSIRERRIYDFLGALTVKALKQNPGQSVSELVEHPVLKDPDLNLGLSVEVLGIVIKHLEAQERLRRTPDEKDGRVLRCYLVDKPAGIPSLEPGAAP